MNLASLPGVVLDGKYRIEQQLGKGGMGAVFLAIHLGTTRTVAVKVIVPQFAAQDEFLLRFHREAEAAGRLRHPNVVNVTDFGCTISDGGPLAYLVMEFLDGENLSDFLKKNPNPASDQILDIVDQVALALDTAHESGIVHRDLKPDNIWLQPNQRGGFNVKVLDFGIAKLHNPAGAGTTSVPASGAVAKPTATEVISPESETVVMTPTTPGDAETVVTFAPLRPGLPPGMPSAASSLHLHNATNATNLQTTVGSVLGTPAYMAPEQCQGANVEASADIYSLSVIVYQMFCGCLPFEAKNLKELLRRQIEELPVPPAERDPGIPKRVSEAIMRGLSKVPAARPASAIGLAAQLRTAAEGEVRLLADGKVVANNHGNSFFPLLLACFAPQIPTLYTLYLAARALAATSAVPAGVVVIVFQILLFAIQFFLSQVYKAGATLLLSDAAAAGHFQRQWRPQFLKLVRGLPSLLATHVGNVFDLRRQSFLASQLWPVVWASEGLSGKAALARASHLAGVEPAVSTALAARQYGIVLVAALFVPCMMGIMSGSLDVYVRILSINSLAWFAILYPTFLVVMLFRFFGPAFFFLYLSARRCLAEGVSFSLPSASRDRRSGRAATLRPMTKVWFAVPVLMSMSLLYVGIRRGTSNNDLMTAAGEGRTTAARRALESGVPVNSARRGWTLLMEAVLAGNTELVRELVSRHADVNAKNSSDETALMIALWHRLPLVAEILISHGANVRGANEDGRTPLLIAAMHGDLETCKLLLDKGADRRHRDQFGKTALDYAKEEGYPDVVALLSAPVVLK